MQRRRRRRRSLDGRYVSTVSVPGLETDCFYCFCVRFSPSYYVLFLTVSISEPETLYLTVSADLRHCFSHLGLARVSDANATLAVVAHNACQQRVRLQHEPCQRESLRGSYGPTRARATHTSSLATSKRSTRAPRPGGLDPPPPGHHRRALSKADSKSWPLECRNSQLERPTLTSNVGRVVVGASAAPAREPRAAWV